MKKILLGSIISTALIVNITNIALAAYTEIQPIGTQLPISDEQNQNDFSRFSGNIISINETNGGYSILVSDTDEAFSGILFNTNENSFLLGNLEVGTHVTGFYRTMGPMGLSMPPQVSAVAIISSDEAISVDVDLFLQHDGTEGFISQNGQLLINLAETTQIQDIHGNNVNIDLAGNNLVVIYDIATRSIPSLTTPNLVVVLPNDITQNINQEGHDIEFSDIDLDDLIVLMPTVDPVDLTNYPVIVQGNGLSIDFLELNDTIYLPLRAIVESIGGRLDWEASLNRVQIIWNDHAFLVYVGTTDFQRDAEAITLNWESVIINGSTYVPLSFFRDVMGFNNAYFHGGHVQINNDEIMQ